MIECRWSQQTDAMKDTVRELVLNGQLEFINGGWLALDGMGCDDDLICWVRCMSDEAAPYYVDMIDQQTLGHQYLLHNIGPIANPKTGWQARAFSS